MRKITLSALSFGLGMLSMSLVGNYTSFAARQSEYMRVPQAVPVVPPFKGNRKVHDAILQGSTFPVDGMLCENCAFKNTEFEYGGGEYVLLDAHISLPMSIKLTGAVKNTAQFLNAFGLLGCPTKQQPSVVNPPPILKAKYAPDGTLKSENAN